MIKVLHILSSLGGGGVEKMLFEYYENMDKDSFLFNFVVHGEKEGILEKPLQDNGSTICHVTPKKVSFIKNFLEIKKAVKNGKYDIVEVHQNYSAFPALFAAWLCRVRVRIVHSHGYIPNDKLTLKKKIYRWLNKKFATEFSACSPEAANWLFGTDKNVKVIYNAINVDKFRFNKDKREEVRKEFSIKDDEICLLQIGRFSPEKNHKFSIDILKQLNNKKYKMIFAGDGDATELAEYIRNNGLEKQVEFLGCIENVENLMCAGDMLLFPSKNEGFGIVAVEAQVNGLYVLASDIVPKSTKISDVIDYLSLNNDEDWIEKIRKYQTNNREKYINTEKFDVKIQAKEYERYLKNLVENN